MPPFGPVTRRELIESLRQLGFSGPFSGGKHAFMSKGSLRVRLPNPHSGDIGKNLLARLLRQAGGDRQTWEDL